MRYVYQTIIALSLAAALLAAIGQGNLNGNELWHMVHEECQASPRQSRNPAPCLFLSDSAGDGRHGYAIVKDRSGVSQFLLVPTVPLSGIGDPNLLLPESENYFADAWKFRLLVSGMRQRLVPRDNLALAINSEDGITQKQLHIHIDCIRRDVASALRTLTAPVGGSDSKEQDIVFGNYKYRLIWLPGTDLTVDPFKLLNRTVPPAGMRHHSIVIVGASRPSDGFWMLDTSGDQEHGAHGEDLQSHENCNTD